MQSLIDVRASRPAPTPIPFREILPWLVAGSAPTAVSVYFIGAKQSAYAFISGNMVHEFLHDGRHLLAFPCH
jgi:hypothetical protein